jgi:hypothetical protein
MNLDFNVLVAQGLDFHRESRWQEAVEHWRFVTNNFPGRPMPLAHMGFALLKIGNVSEAAVCYRTLVEKHPANPWGYIGGGLILEANHQWASAEDSFASVLRRFPENPQAFLGLAKALAKQGKTLEAKACLQKGISFNPLPAMQKMLQKLNGVRKTDIVNQLIQGFGLSSYLEYNKPRCELAIDEVVCASKQVVYIPELALEAYTDERLRAECLRVADVYSDEVMLEPQQLLDHFGERKFDLIFFDPAHVRPLVDSTLKMLPRLLSRDGMLVVHDCNPSDAKMVGPDARSGAWCGETYKAFANFHLHNPDRSLTVDEDFGVAVILNRDLNLDYSDEFDVDYEDFSRDRVKFNGLMAYEDFQARLAGGDPIRLFAPSNSTA